MSRFGGRIVPVVVTPIGIPDRRGNELRGLDVVKAREENANEVAAHVVRISGLVGIHGARRAEVLERCLGMLVIAPELVRPSQQAKSRRLNEGLPGACLRAEGAIAPPRSLREIEIRFESDRSAMTAALIRLGSH